MANLVAGWILFALGLVTWVVAVYKFASAPKPTKEDIERGMVAKEWTDLVEAIAKALEQLRQFTESAQWALLSLIPLGAGLYILSAKPL